MKVVDHTTCAGCRARISELVPADIVLTKWSGSEKRFYHTWCEEVAQRLVSESPPGTWNLTHRHLFWNDAS